VRPDGGNPQPVRLVRPEVAPLSAMAQLGRGVFFDTTLSSSGALSCASCHSPQHAYGPPGDLPVMEGGRALTRQGVRAVPSLMYLERQPNFSIGPDDAENEAAPSPLPSGAPAIAVKSAQNTAQSAQNLVPQGGLFWDGRVNTLQSQALEPLLNPLEMDGGSVGGVAQRLRRAPYSARFAQLFGPQIFDRANMLVGEALFAVARYQIEDPSFHPYSSKYDAWLEGKARFSPAEARGYALFRDPHGANCAACHLDRPDANGLPPLFTDHQFEALGAPRNTALAANRNPRYFDLGICGPVRMDMKRATPYCGMFLTPTLRNVATRRTFFHNGVYQTLAQVLDFYDFRSSRPQRVYRHGGIDDLPPAYRANLDTADAPFDRTPAQGPPLTARQEHDVIAFLQTLTDGYRPSK
jgi:cytochrome c peroxidase